MQVTWIVLVCYLVNSPSGGEESCRSYAVESKMDRAFEAAESLATMKDTCVRLTLMSGSDVESVESYNCGEW